MNRLAEGALWYAVFLYSTAFHEAAHAFVALRLGDRTAEEAGQVTLDPIPHIRREPFGTVVVPILSFVLGGWMVGWASTPYDPQWADRFPKRSGAMSLAGPVANLSLVLAAGLFVHLGIWTGLFRQPESIGFSTIVVPAGESFFSPLATLVSVLFSLNLLLALFNLMPVPPLDGSGAVSLFLPEGGARRYAQLLRNPAFSLLGLLIAWRFFGAVFYPVHRLAIHLLYPGSLYH